MNLAAALILNVLIPYLGNLSLRPNKLRLSIVAITTLIVAVSLKSGGDVVFGILYINEIKLIADIMLVVLLIHSSYLAVKERHSLTFSWIAIGAPLTFLGSLFTFYALYDVRASEVMARSLEPFVERGAVVSMTPTDRVERKRFALVMTEPEKTLRLGIVLALPGDAIGAIGGRPAVCASRGGITQCEVLTSIVCENPRTIAPRTELTNVRQLGPAEVALATFLDIGTVDALNLTVHRVGKLYAVKRIFSPGLGIQVGHRLDLTC